MFPPPGTGREWREGWGRRVGKGMGRKGRERREGGGLEGPLCEILNTPLLPQTMQYVSALSPPIAGERVGVEGWGGNGHLLEAYSTKPTCKPQSTMCTF